MPWREFRAAALIRAQSRQYQCWPHWDGAGRAWDLQIHWWALKYPTGPEGLGALTSCPSSTVTDAQVCQGLALPRRVLPGPGSTCRGSTRFSPGAGNPFLVHMQERGELGGLHLRGKRGPRTHPGCRAPLQRHSLGWEGKAPASSCFYLLGSSWPTISCPCVSACLHNSPSDWTHWQVASVTLHPGKAALGSHWATVEPLWWGEVSSHAEMRERTRAPFTPTPRAPVFFVSHSDLWNPPYLGSFFSPGPLPFSPSCNSQCGGGMVGMAFSLYQRQHVSEMSYGPFVASEDKMIYCSYRD